MKILIWSAQLHFIFNGQIDVLAQLFCRIPQIIQSMSPLLFRNLRPVFQIAADILRRLQIEVELQPIHNTVMMTI